MIVSTTPRSPGLQHNEYAAVISVVEPSRSASPHASHRAKRSEAPENVEHECGKSAEFGMLCWNLRKAMHVTSANGEKRRAKR